jgi:DNA-binding NtrC family response regulator
MASPYNSDRPPYAEVLVWDQDPHRVERVSTVVAGCGGRAIAPPPPSRTFDAGEVGAWASVALVSLGAGAPGVAALEVIQRLAGKHVRVISYGERANFWSLGARCRALLAGACAVLDSEAPGFLQELQAKLAHLLSTEAAQRRETEQVRRLFHDAGIAGDSDAMLAIFHRTVRISGLSDLHTLITGETGTGKELLAEAIHRFDRKRCASPFVALNCGAISAGLAESELFGHRRGAFTGADRDRKGLFRAAQDGVLFLDEIGELDLALQTKLLRVLQEGRVLGVGDDREVPVNVRVIAATNRNLEAMVRERTFRADLFHRLNVLSIHVPPLRDRPADIAALVRHFLGKHGHLRGNSPPSASDEFVAALAEDDLPGNARQVENLVRSAIVHKDDEGPLALIDLPREIWERVSRRGAAADAAGAHFPSRDADEIQATSYLSSVLALNDWNLSRALASCERSLVEVALEEAHGNQSQTARLLGITPRSVYNKIRKHQLSRSDS